MRVIPLTVGGLFVIFVVFSHMLIDGSCDTGDTGFVGPLPSNAEACTHVGGTWTASTGLLNVAYEIGHIAFWPVVACVGIGGVFLLARRGSPRRGVTPAPD